MRDDGLAKVKENTLLELEEDRLRLSIRQERNFQQGESFPQ